MKLTGVLGDDRAVSPVVGTILMVAITVILAAVIGAAVFGVIGNIGDTAPQATFQWQYRPVEHPSDIAASGNDSLVVQHAGGETLQLEHVSVRVAGARDEYSKKSTSRNSRGKTVTTWTNLTFDAHYDGVAFTSREIDAGTTGTINSDDFTWGPYGGSFGPYDHLRLNASHVSLVWNDGQRSVVLSSWRGPDASS